MDDEETCARLRRLEEAGIRAQSDRDIDLSMLVALVKTHPDPASARAMWRELSTAMTADRAVRAAAQPAPSWAADLSSKAIQERTAFWERLLDGLLRDTDD